MDVLVDVDKELFGMTTLCNGGKLKAIVFCCSVEKECPYRDKALELLGIDKDMFESIKRSYREYDDDRLCYGNLAFCCPLDKRCKKRDEVLHDKDMSPKDYIAFKTELLKKFREVAKSGNFEEKVCFHYVATARELDGNRQFALVLFGNPEVSSVLFVKECAEIKDGIPIDSKPNTEIVSIRLSQELLEKLDTLAKEWGKSRSEVIRTILARATTAVNHTLLESPALQEGN